MPNDLLLNMFTVGGSHARLPCLKGAILQANGFCGLASFLYAFKAWLRVPAVNIFCVYGLILFWRETVKIEYFEYYFRTINDEILLL